jgi:hypothetical protein
MTAAAVAVGVARICQSPERVPGLEAVLDHHS